MSRTPARHTQADIARVVRAHRGEGIRVRIRLMPDGSTLFEPIERAAEEVAEIAEKEIVL